ncbi:MAG: LacI family DNA-binding transcriptional regulator [Bacteroidota bacterium]
MRRNAHITLADIAGRLNVSRVTVSKALRGHPDISEEMAKKIRKLATDLGYSPNRMARNLSSRRSHLLGLVVPKIAHFFFGSVIESVYNRALDHQYETILMVSHENEEQEVRHLQTLVSMRVDGIIISVSARTRDISVFDWIKKVGIPLLFMDRLPDPAPKNSVAVLVDDYGGATRAVRQALSLGYETIAFLGGDRNINIGRDRLRGYEEALRSAGREINKELIVPGGYGTDAGYEGFMRLMSRGALPRCIFAVTYPVALGVYEAAKANGVRIPSDVDVICFGDSDVGRLITPALSCVGQPTQRLGEESVNVMMKMIESPESVVPGNIIIPTELILRETCVGTGSPSAQNSLARIRNAVP